MRELRITFEDKEFETITKIKDGLSWHDFFMLLITHAKELIKRGDLEIFKNKKKEVTKDGKNY
jgi:hypothetical protein